jgi:transcriptional antiterminator
MLYIHDTSEKITIKKLAKALNVSSRTIHRNMDLNLKTEKNLLNEELQRRKLCTL